MKLGVWILKRRQIDHDVRSQALNEVAHSRMSGVDRLLDPPHRLFVRQRYVTSLEMISCLVESQGLEVFGDELEQIVGNLKGAL